jgi:hypothetical protein
VDYLDADGRGEQVDRRLAEAGVSRHDLPMLRRAAMTWVAAYSPVTRTTSA